MFIILNCLCYVNLPFFLSCNFLGSLHAHLPVSARSGKDNCRSRTALAFKYGDNSWWESVFLDTSTRHLDRKYSSTSTSLFLCTYTSNTTLKIAFMMDLHCQFFRCLLSFECLKWLGKWASNVQSCSSLIQSRLWAHHLALGYAICPIHHVCRASHSTKSWIDTSLWFEHQDAPISGLAMHIWWMTFNSWRSRQKMSSTDLRLLDHIVTWPGECA